MRRLPFITLGLLILLGPFAGGCASTDEADGESTARPTSPGPGATVDPAYEISREAHMHRPIRQRR